MPQHTKNRNRLYFKPYIIINNQKPSSRGKNNGSLNQMETKYGIVELSYAICDTNGTDLLETIEVKLNDEVVGEIPYDDYDDLDTKQLETILETLI